MATHSSILAWKIPWTQEYGKLQSMRLQRVRYDSDFTHYTESSQGIDVSHLFSLIFSNLEQFFSLCLL